MDADGEDRVDKMEEEIGAEVAQRHVSESVLARNGLPSFAGEDYNKLLL